MESPGCDDVVRTFAVEKRLLMSCSLADNTANKVFSSLNFRYVSKKMYLCKSMEFFASKITALMFSDKVSKRCLVTFLLFLFCGVNAIGQFVQGTITDSKTGEALPGARVFYQKDQRTLVASNDRGQYKIGFRKGDLVFSMIGYETQIIHVTSSKKLNVKMMETASMLTQVEVMATKRRYTRKDNPAVALMEKVIAAKKKGDLREKDFYSYKKYEKMTMSMNEVTSKVFEDDHFKRMPFLKEHVEVNPETGKLVLPLTIDEKVSQVIYRKNPKSEKNIVMGERSEGVNDFINTGDILSALMADCFTDVNIYEDDVRLLQHPFTSPIASNAIRFYRYYIADTVMVDRQKCYKVEFGPNNEQDFGFSGTLWVLADSTWQLKRVHLGIPSRSDVNYVEHMDIVQNFEQLPTGERVVTDNKMIIQLMAMSWIQKFQVERTVRLSDFDFSPISGRNFRIKGDTKVESSAKMRDDEFWQEQRPTPLTTSESQMKLFMNRIENMKGFKYVLWVLKAFVENYVETSVNPDRPSKVDIGPVNTVISSNFVEGFKLRASAQTTANLNKHWFGRGYVGYGFGDKRWKGLAEVTYALKPKDYLPREFPKNNLSASYYYDVIAPSDRFITMDKDNVFTSFKWTKVDHMSYIERMQLRYDREWESGLHLMATARREKAEGAGELFFQPLHAKGVDGAARPESALTMPEQDKNLNHRYLTTTDLSLSLEYQPGASWVNTKQRRVKTNSDTPVMGVTHTTGFKGMLNGEYDYNLTDFTFYKRFWLKTWGKFDFYAKAQYQWNKVPFPLLCFPVANLSYIKHDNAFGLINNMEFITDRNASVFMTWDLNGKLFNRIPLIKMLKWREYIGCNMYWGYLSDKNNPFLRENADDSRLFYFPGHFNEDGSFAYNSQLMQARRPYVELVAGVHNVFKLFYVEYVHRINYLRPGTQRWGIRIMFRASF